MLVLPDPNMLRLNLHEFGHRVNQATSKGYGATVEVLKIGEFAHTDLRRRVNRRTTLVYDIYTYRPRITQLVKEIFSLS